MALLVRLPADWQSRPVAALQERGSAIYLGECTLCHGVSGDGGAGGPALRTPHIARLSVPELFAIVALGRPEKGMPRWEAALDGNDLLAVSVFIRVRAAEPGAGAQPLEPAPAHRP